MKTLPEEAIAHIVERPSFLNATNMRGERGKAIAKIAETLKMIEASKCLVYDIREWEKEFGEKKYSVNNFRTKLKELGITKLRIARDNGKIYIWSHKI